MSRIRRMKKAHAALAASLLSPAVALAFETVDTLPWPSTGRFPAYASEATGAPTDLWVQGGVMYDDNLLRLENGALDDTVMRFGGGLRTAQRVYGRQTLVVDARADYYMFDRFDNLDHLAYAAAADWRWELGNKLSGSIALGRERRLADLSETQSPVRSIVTGTRLTGSAAYLITPSLRLRGGVGGTRSERSTRGDAETRAASALAAVEYVSGLGNTVGVEARTANGDAPVDEEIAGVALVNNDFEEREIALVAGYALGPRLRADGRLGRTTREYSELPSRNFEGTTWRFGGEWLPGNKTSLALAFFKEPRSIIDIAASHVLVKGVTFGPSWAPTAKTVLSLRLLREVREFQGDPRLALGLEPLREETIDALRFGIGWEPQRHWQVGLALDTGKRSSNVAGRDYDFTALIGNVAWRY
jgi:hypothetical protein